MLAEVAADEYAAALDRVAGDALWEAGVDLPPVDAFRVARRLRIAVASDDALDGRARCVRLAGACEPTILLAPETRPERRHWAVAHEVGEVISHRVYQMLGVDPREGTPPQREAIANALAGRLLLPSKWLRGVYRDFEGDLPRLKRTFATASNELIVRRLLECVRDPLIATVYDRGRLTWRRWNRPGPAPGVDPAESAAQRESHRSSTAVEARAVALDEPWFFRARCWSVHEPGWRREVLLTELPEV